MTKCETPKLKYLRGSASPTIKNDEFLEAFSYVGIEGPLIKSFDKDVGKFTAQQHGIYTFVYYITFQNQEDGDKRNDGERLCQLRRTFATPRIENSFIGQYHSVPSQKIGITPFFTLMNISATLEMEKGDTVQLAVYQNNTDQEDIIAFIEFHFVFLSKLCPLLKTNNQILAKSDPINYPHQNGT
uniref:C1q domain protein n=1 Tax=Pithovirus LCPAC201 TaxID=2506591 RepID=A0A481Z899_9VIRU|nr:MAG: hypothetical protein LCPAC201_02220 [Pithovirus LCPAC201]